MILIPYIGQPCLKKADLLMEEVSKCQERFYEIVSQSSLVSVSVRDK